MSTTKEFIRNVFYPLFRVTFSGRMKYLFTLRCIDRELLHNVETIKNSKIFSPEIKKRFHIKHENPQFSHSLAIESYANFLHESQGKCCCSAYLPRYKKETKCHGRKNLNLCRVLSLLSPRALNPQVYHFIQCPSDIPKMIGAR